MTRDQLRIAFFEHLYNVPSFQFRLKLDSYLDGNCTAEQLLEDLRALPRDPAPGR